MKKLHRSRTQRMIAGVCGGLGETYGIDPTLLRLIFVVLLLVTGLFPFGILYLIAWVIMPLEY